MDETNIEWKVARDKFGVCPFGKKSVKQKKCAHMKPVPPIAAQSRQVLSCRERDQ